jgi:hypothetical protein
MFRLRYVFAASVAACLVGGLATAQPAQPAQQPASGATTPATQDQTTPAAPAASDAASQASATTTQPASANVAVTVDANGARHLVISSPPVPDTPDNRAKYGGPMSNGGQKTGAAGN